MLEVKGRANTFLIWVIGGVLLAFVGWALWESLLRSGFPLSALPPGLEISGALCVGIGIWKALDKKPVIVVDVHGLVDRTSSPQRTLRWSEIEGFRLVPVGAKNPKFMAIDLVNPERMISNALYGSATVLEALQKQFGTPCVITLRTLEIEPSNLLDRLKGSMRQHKR